MCGIAGMIESDRPLNLSLRKGITRMTDAIRHRGPDDYGYWEDLNMGVGLGHRRLSILDLSDQGHQPMISENGRYVIVYNGEIYNYEEIRNSLNSEMPVVWRGHSDTEVALAAIEHWGLVGALKRFNGMFAFALWDRNENVLSLTRDRLGKKPLYYGWCGGHFLFASEIKAIKAAAIGPMEVNRHALPLLMRLNYIPAPHSIYYGIYKLQSGCVLSMSLKYIRNPYSFEASVSEDMVSMNRPWRYWSVKRVIENGTENPYFMDEGEWLGKLDDLLRDATKIRMIADVPLGAFLSGGVDSSIVVALMQAQSGSPVKTFSIGYHEKDSDEAHYAKAVAKHIGTDHTELYVSPEDVLNLIPRLPVMSDEPHSDLAIIPTFLVSQMARKDVTVCLSGDGGDEVFAGYPRYLWTQERWKKEHDRFWWLTSVGRTLIGQLLKSVLGSAGKDDGSFTDKLRDLGLIFSLRRPEDVYREWVFHWKNPEEVIINGNEPETVITNETLWSTSADPVQKMVYLDMVSRLPDSIVSKVDRTTMQVSLEARAPLLDYRVMEFAAHMPTSMKIRNGMGKWLLRELLNRYVPRSLVERPKKGFKMPITNWMKGPLRDWAEDLLNPRRLADEGFFKPEVVSCKWQEHVSGRKEWPYQLWDVLMFQAWLRAEKSY